MTKWTFVTERRPSRDDADRNGMVLVKDKCGYVSVTRYGWVNPSSVSIKWCRIPEDGEGE